MGITVYPTPTQTVTFGDSGQTDAFGRMRVSNPSTLFDSKQLHDSQPLFWDDTQVSGTATTAHSTATAATTIGVNNTTAGKRVRQTFMRFNYQPGKSQLIFLTGVLDKSGGGTGITRGMGWYDDNDGVFLYDNAGTYQWVIRSSASGSPVDTAVSQSSWNLDTMDGTGSSGITVDFSKANIVVIDAEWLGVGRVRVGLNIGGTTYYCHEFNHANSVTAVYMSTPNLPLRYEIENDGTGAASTLDHICSTVISEGGIQDNGVLRYHSTQGTHLDLASANTLYPVLGIRLKSTALDGIVALEDMTIINQQSQDWEWVLLMDNPALTFVGGTPSFSAQTNSVVETHTGDGSISITGGGTYFTGGLVASGTKGSATSSSLKNAVRLGATRSGTVDEIYLCARPLSANADIEASITWREIS
jgi:hypothetical protein